MNALGLRAASECVPGLLWLSQAFGVLPREEKAFGVQPTPFTISCKPCLLTLLGGLLWVTKLGAITPHSLPAAPRLLSFIAGFSLELAQCQARWSREGEISVTPGDRALHQNCLTEFPSFSPLGFQDGCSPEKCLRLCDIPHLLCVCVIPALTWNISQRFHAEGKEWSLNSSGIYLVVLDITIVVQSLQQRKESATWMGTLGPV